MYVIDVIMQSTPYNDIQKLIHFNKLNNDYNNDSPQCITVHCIEWCHAEKLTFRDRKRFAGIKYTITV